MRRRSLLVGAGAMLAGCGGGEEGMDDSSPTPAAVGASPGTGAPSEGEFSVSSTAFADGDAIPEQYSCDGEDVSPPLSFDGIPGDAESFALVMDDPGAPRKEPFVHWLLWNLPVDRHDLPEGVPAAAGALHARQGTNAFGDVGYGGPCPPENDDAHSYRFLLYALEGTVDVEAGAERDALESAMEGTVVGEALLMGEYERG